MDVRASAERDYDDFMLHQLELVVRGEVTPERKRSSRGFDVQPEAMAPSSKLSKVTAVLEFSVPEALNIYSRRVNYHELTGADLPPCDKQIEQLKASEREYLAKIFDADGVYRLLEKTAASPALLEGLKAHCQQWGTFSDKRQDVSLSLLMIGKDDIKVESCPPGGYLQDKPDTELQPELSKVRHKQFRQLVILAAEDLKKSQLYRLCEKTVNDLQHKYLAKDKRLKYPLWMQFFSPSNYHNANYLHQDDGWLQFFFATSESTVIYPLLVPDAQRGNVYHPHCKIEMVDRPETCKPVCLNKALDEQGYGVQPPANNWYICSGKVIHRAPLNVTESRCLVGGNIFVSPELRALLSKDGNKKEFMTMLHEAIGLNSCAQAVAPSTRLLSTCA